MYENTIKPNNLANFKGQESNTPKLKSVCINYKSMTRQ